MKKNRTVVLGLLPLLLATGGLSSCGVGDADIVFFNWGEYIKTDLIDAFEQETGYRVKVQTFQDNEGMLTKLSNSHYDVVCPSDYAIEELYQENKIQKLDTDRFEYYKKDRLISSLRTNLEAMNTPVQNASGETVLKAFPFLDYAVPYTWGEVGLVYDKTKVSEEDLASKGWDILRDSDYKVALYDSSRDVYSIALCALGIDFVNFSSNETRMEALDKADEWLRGLPKDTSFLTDELLESMPNHDFDIALDYSGDAFYSIMNDTKPDAEGNPTLGFYIPDAKEGSPVRTNIFSDALVITKDCANTDAAYAFIDFLSKMETNEYIAAENQAEIGYVTPFQDAMDVLTDSEDNKLPAYTENKDIDPTGTFASIADEYDLGKVASILDKFYRYDDELKSEMENRYSKLKTQF